jgi:hypothetical protein
MVMDCVKALAEWFALSIRSGLVREAVGADEPELVAHSSVERDSETSSTRVAL